ncbi:hypothetical protein, partial [Streptomyces sp. NPDC091278]|uniref:hypothetical protein n=1 Tax=Streptomyces sp. NPDC091278 TaxID=3155301 RepID=UPI00344D2B1D
MGGAKRDSKQFALQGTGPAQSDTLVHFTSRGEYASFTPKVPEEFRQMTAQERLDSILGSGRLYGYPPFGAQQACVCFSERSFSSDVSSRDRLFCGLSRVAPGDGVLAG